MFNKRIFKNILSLYFNYAAYTERRHKVDGLESKWTVRVIIHFDQEPSRLAEMAVSFKDRRL